jgi:hypothetical protein
MPVAENRDWEGRGGGCTIFIRCDARVESPGMKAARTKAKNPLKPEVLAVIRSSFDGYNEPDSGRTAKKSALQKRAAKKTAAEKGVAAKTKAVPRGKAKR